MALRELVKELTDGTRIGLTPELLAALKIADPDIVRARMESQLEEETDAYLSVRLIGAYVVDDTDVLGKGEIYWWSVSALGEADGSVHWSALTGLPNGAPPIRCGDEEWMREPSPQKPGLLAVIPPSKSFVACLLRLAFFDDDREKANVPRALQAGIEALAAVPATQKDPDAIFGPVREALSKSLVAAHDDRLLEKEVRILRGSELAPFDAGMIGSVVTPLAHAYYFVQDEKRTTRHGPFTLAKGQSELVRFATPPPVGARVAIFSRAAASTSLGALTTTSPFLNVIVDAEKARLLTMGLTIEAQGAGDLAVYVTT